MSKGIFTEKIHEPSEDEIFEALLSVKPLWDDLREFIEDNYKISGELKFYGKNFGWALRYRKSGRVLVSMYPGSGEFIVQIILNGKEVEKAMELDLEPDTMKVIVDTEPIHEGKWIYINVTSETDLSDVEDLISVRSPLKL
ncbi:DUF3788 domain-containing protein [Methanobacterium aggregans]|uniref:DUF3788 domain-containing protein n=1 Tax=Methanobacterium aggregans TaxID=1615586 RepID=UPI001AE66CF8|nr:DUF3788 domain-containing protein [Methanobacterium aggregans]MBP2046441.1 hypothetical protein [Methanobacterium aggregans]